MGEEHDGAAGPGRIEQVLLQGRRQSLGEVRRAERYVIRDGHRKPNAHADPTHIERYFKALKEGKVHGYLFEQQNYIPKEGGNS